MAKPILMLKGADIFVKSLKKLNKKPAKKVVKPKIKAKKKVKVVVPVRPSPFEVGDLVWYTNSSRVLVRGFILKCEAPLKTHNEIEWMYSIGSKDHVDALKIDESDIYLDSMFTLNATDAVKMRISELTSTLNSLFGANACIFEVYRQGQKRPWTYYVLPDKDLLFKSVVYEQKPYGASTYTNTVTSIVYIKPPKHLAIRLRPVSSAPQEILTYLGLHIYNRKWKSAMEGDQE